MTHYDKNETDDQTWFTVAEAAAYIRVSRQTIYRCMEDGVLTYYVLKYGGGGRIKREEIGGLLEPLPDHTGGNS